MNDKVYIHEFIDIIGHNRARYMHHMTANWCPVAREERNQLCFGVWGTLGSTGRWPEVVNMWELDGWDGLAANFAHELASRRCRTSRSRSGGRSRPSCGAAASTASSSRSRGARRSRSCNADGVRGEVYAHELVTLPVGTVRRFLDGVRDIGRPTVESLGVRAVGAYRVAMVNDSEAIVIWAIPDWTTWARFEQAWDREPLAGWQQWLVGLGAGVRRTLMNDAPLSPLRLGRQPNVEDRRPLSEIGP